MDRTVIATRDEADVALEPFGTLPDWLAAVMAPDRLEASLRQHTPGLDGGGAALLRAVTDQLRAKGDRWLVRCLVELSRPGGPDSREVVLVGELHPPGRESRGARDPRGSPGEPGWLVWLPDLRLELEVEELDPALPAVGDLVDPEASARLIEGVLRCGAYPQARVVVSAPQVVRYKPGSRCTILHDLTYETPSPTLPNPVIAKIHQGEKGARSHQAMTALWRTTLAGSEQVLLPEPLGYVDDLNLQLQGPVPEDRILKDVSHEAFAAGDPGLLAELRRELAATARGLATLHGSGAVLPEVVTFEEELEKARELVVDLSATVPDLASWAGPTLQLLADASLAVQSDDLVSSHNSFSPAQVLLGSGPPAFIDFDSAAMGEPAMDVGRFRAGLRCVGVPALAKRPEGYRPEVVADRLALLDEICDEFLSTYQGHHHVTPSRVALWETLDLFVSLLHTWTKGRVEKVTPRLVTLRHALQDPLLPVGAGVP